MGEGFCRDLKKEFNEWGLGKLAKDWDENKEYLNKACKFVEEVKDNLPDGEEIKEIKENIEQVQKQVSDKNDQIANIISKEIDNQEPQSDIKKDEDEAEGEDEEKDQEDDDYTDNKV